MARLKRFIISILRFPIPTAMAVLALTPALTGMSGCHLAGGGITVHEVCRPVRTVSFTGAGLLSGAEVEELSSGPITLDLSSWVPADMTGGGFGTLDADIDVRLLRAIFTAESGVSDFGFVESATGYLSMPRAAAPLDDGGMGGDSPDAGAAFATRNVLNYQRSGADAPSPLAIPLVGDFDASDILSQGPVELELILTGVVPESAFSVGIELCVSFTGTAGVRLD